MQQARYSIFLIPCLILSCDKAWQGDPAQVQSLREFYEVVLSIKDRGIPGNSDLSRLKPFLSHRLHLLLVRGCQVEWASADKTRKENRPLLEGSLFFSFYEGADHVLGCTPEPVAGRASYLIECGYGDIGISQKPLRWNERVFLVKESEKWVVDEVEFLGNWIHSERGNLSDWLSRVIKQAKEQSGINVT